jgi:hypothetical protein
MLRHSVLTEAEFKGNQAIFLVADSGGAVPNTRGVNGLIPARGDDLNQFTCTLVEWHDLVRRTSFNIFASQGDGRRVMQETTRKVMNRKVDQDILGELQNATLTTGSPVQATLNLVTKAMTILGNNAVDVEEEDNMFGVISWAFHAYLSQIPEYTKADYVEIKPFNMPQKKFRRWFGINWIVHPNIVGKGTSLEYCFLYHRNAIGHAVNTGDIQARAGYHEEQDYSWARTTGFFGSKLLQNSGIVVMKHDGSQFTAS